MALAALRVEGPQEWPVDQAAMGALARVPAHGRGLMESDPEGQIGGAQGQLQFEERWIGA